MEPHRRETADRGPSEIRVDLPLCLRAPQQREGPLADPTHGKCTGVLHSARELRQGGGSGKEETHRAGSRQGRLAHSEEGSGGARRDTPGVPTLPLPGAPTLREAVAPFQRGGSEPLLRGDRRVGGGARSALRGPERQARAHPIVHPLPLVAASGMTNKAIQTDLVLLGHLCTMRRADFRENAHSRSHLMNVWWWGWKENLELVVFSKPRDRGVRLPDRGGQDRLSEDHYKVAKK